MAAVEALLREVARLGSTLAGWSWTIRHWPRWGEEPVTFLTAALSSLLPLLWFEPGKVLQGADFNNPLNPSREIDQIFGGWQPDNLGEPTFRQIPRLFPYLSFWRAGELIHLSDGGIQRAWFVVLFLLALGSAWVFLALLIPTRGRRGWAVIPIGLAYVFNPFTLHSWAVGHTVPFLAYAAAPLWLATLLWTLKRQARFTSGFPLALVSLLFASSANNIPTLIALVVFPSFILLLLVLVTRQENPLTLATRCLACVPWLLALNAWWVLPAMGEVLSGTRYDYGGSSLATFDYASFLVPVDFSEFMRGMGYWGDYDGSWAASYSSPLLIATTTLVIGLSFASLLNSRKPRALASFAALIVLIGIFLSKGVNPPLEDVSKWLFAHVPGFFVFRATYEKFGGLTFLGTFIGLALFTLGKKPGSRSRTLVSVSILFAVVANAWPLFTGAVAPSEKNSNGVARVVRIPESYGDLLNWTRANADEVGALLTLPQPPTGYLKTTWGYFGADPIYNFSAVPIVTGVPDARREDGPRFATLLDSAFAFDQPDVLRATGITHVVVRQDFAFDPLFYPDTEIPSQAEVEQRLLAAGFAREASFGILSIYRVPPSVSPNPEENLAVDTELRRGTEGVPIVRVPPEIDASMKGVLENIDGYAWVVLPQTFNPNWRLDIEEGGSSRVISHQVADLYANAWLIRGEGDIAFEVRYDTAVSPMPGVLVSVAALLIGTFLSIRSKGRARNSRAPDS